MLKETKFRSSCGNTIKECSGRAWSGIYHDGTLGFCMPDYVSQYPQNLTSYQIESLLDKSKNWGSSDFYRVEVSVRLVLNGNYIDSFHRRINNLWTEHSRDFGMPHRKQGIQVCNSLK